MTILNPLAIIRAMLAEYGDNITAEQIIDAIELNGWRFVRNIA